MFWNKNIGRHAGWPRTFHIRGNSEAIIIASHLTPTGAWLADKFFILPIIYGIYHFGDLMRGLESPVYQLGNVIATLMPSLEERFGGWAKILMQPIDKNFGREGLIVMVLSMATIALGSVLMRRIMRKVILKPMIIHVGLKAIRIGFKRYDWQLIESLYLQNPETADMEGGQNSSYYRHSTQLYINYNNVPMQIASIYEAVKARKLVGRLQAIGNEIRNRQPGNSGEGRF